jgi:hypothetical protein
VRQESIVLAVFVTAQVLDGLLTGWGVLRFGTNVELNPLLTTAIHTFGLAPALVGAKAVATTCGVILYATACHRPLAITAGLYVGVAVVPWLLALVVGL